MGATNEIDKKLLKSVSRSFYTSLWALPSKIRPTMSMAYLFCRTADSLADTNLLPEDKKLNTLSEFKLLFERFPPLPSIATEFSKSCLDALSVSDTAEYKLVRSFDKNFEIFSHYPHTDQALINDVVRSVTQGMIMDLTTFGSPGSTPKALKTEIDLDQYLLLMGGEPGRFWTRSCLNYFPSIGITDRATWIHKGIALGKGLQLVNILRDLAKDLKMGRCYIPDDILNTYQLTIEDLMNIEKTTSVLPLYQNLIDHAAQYLEQGLAYIEMIPHHYFRLRMAAWWPLIFGIRTLVLLRNNKDILNPALSLKLTRSEIYREMGISVGKVMSNKLLRVDFNYWKKISSATID